MSTGAPSSPIRARRELNSFSRRTTLSRRSARMAKVSACGAEKEEADAETMPRLTEKRK